MNTSKTTHVLLVLMLSTFSVSTTAGNLYRFEDENGIVTMSKSLPPYAAKKGYDILNDKTLRLIKHVKPALTAEQIAKKEQQLAEQKEAERLQAAAEKKRQEQNRQQAITDQNLLASYSSEQALLDARDSDISYRQTELTKTEEHLTKNQDKLQTLQQQAAEQELSGQTVTENMTKRLAATQQEIINSKSEIQRLNLEIEQITQQYESDLVRLQYLLSN